jgi:hypothetical protein
VLRVHHSDYRLIRHQVLYPPCPVPGFFLQLPYCRLVRFLALIDQAARQLPTPPVLHKPVPPQHQHPLLLINKHHHRGPAQSHYVMPEALATGYLNVYLAQPHPRVVIDRAPPERAPPGPLTIRYVSHGPDANASLPTRRARRRTAQDPAAASSTAGTPP